VRVEVHLVLHESPAKYDTPVRRCIRMKRLRKALESKPLTRVPVGSETINAKSPMPAPCTTNGKNFSERHL